MMPSELIPSMTLRRRRLGIVSFAIIATISINGVESFSGASTTRAVIFPHQSFLSASTASSSSVVLDDDSGTPSKGDEIPAAAPLINPRDRPSKKKNKKKGSSSSSKPFVNQETIRFNNQLNGMARNFDTHSAEKVEELLRKTLREISMGLELEIQPNVVTFTAAINAWARSRRPDAAERAEAILQWMLELSPVKAPANTSSSPGVGEIDEFDLTESRDEVNLADVLFIKPNCIAFNAAITAWVRSSAKDSHNHAERLMDQLWDLYMASDQDPELKPSARTFNLVINAIARSREPRCGDRAAALLRKMEDLYTAGDQEMEPDSQTFGAIINAYANDSQNDPQSTDKAAQILQQMNSMYQMGYKGMKPTTFVYNACLNAFAKSEDNAHQATQLLEMMEQQYYSKGDMSVKPDVISYSTCINAHANSKTMKSGPMAEEILRRMTRRYILDGDVGVKPNAVTYTATIKAWMTFAAAAAAAGGTAAEDGKQVSSYAAAACQAAERAEAILNNMCLQYLAGDGDQKPTKVTFDLVYEAFVNAGDQESADHVASLKKRILGHNLPRRESV